MSSPAHVVLLCGPSGSGKSHLAARSGLPVFRLDDFYKDGDDPSLPFSAELGIVDWDDPRAWHGDVSVASLVELCGGGAVQVPAYDIGTSRTVGSSTFDRGTAPAVVAEGVFAAEIIEQCREHGILADAVVLHRAPWKNFVRRFIRDLLERRKPPRTLWHRGRVLMRTESALVAAAEARGCRRVSAAELTVLLTRLSSQVDA